jgi:hypothetical protein
MRRSTPLMTAPGRTLLDPSPDADATTWAVR